MEKDLIYIPEIVSSECFSCKSNFKLYLVQKIGIDLCKECSINESFYKLTTLPGILKKIANFAEEKNKKIEDRLVVDISELFEELQK